MPPDTLPTRSFISNNHQTASFSTQLRLSKNFSSGIKAIPFPILQGTNPPILLSSMRIIVNGVSGSNPGSGIGSLIVFVKGGSVYNETALALWDVQYDWIRYYLA